MTLLTIFSLFIHLYTYSDILSESDMSIGYPVLVIDDPFGVYVFLTPEGTMMNIETLPDAIIFSPSLYETSPARWGYVSHLFESSPPFSVVLAFGLRRIMLSVGGYTTLF